MHMNVLDELQISEQHRAYNNFKDLTASVIQEEGYCHGENQVSNCYLTAENAFEESSK